MPVYPGAHNVTPPGTFPNGGWQTTPYTAHVSSAELASGAAQAKKAYSEAEAGRHKATAYEWGGDPPEETVYFTLAEAYFWTTQIAANESFDIVFDFWKYLKSTIVKPVIEWVEEEIGVHDIADWLDTIKAGFEECINTGGFFLEQNWMLTSGQGGARCRLGIPMVTIFEIKVLGTVYAKLEIPDMRQLPNVALCAEYAKECIPTAAAP